MSAFSVDGLASGLDTTSIIEQLMAVEAQPVRRMESRRDDLNARSTAWSDLDSRLDTLTSAIENVVDNDGVSVLAGEASNPDVTITPTGIGAVGTFEVQVDQIATAQQLMSARFASPADLVGAGQFSISSGLGDISADDVIVQSLETGTYTVEVVSVEPNDATVVFDGETFQVDPDQNNITLQSANGNRIRIRPDGELTVGTMIVSTIDADGTTTVGGLVTEFNNQSAAAAVQIVDTGDGSNDPFTLVITSRSPGLDNEIKLDQSSGLLGPFTEIREASNTIVSMGDGDLVIERSDVVVDGVIPGMAVDLTGAEVGETLRITVSRDTEAIVGNVREVVDAANSLFSGISSYGRSDPENEAIGLLAGDFSLRRLERQLRDAFAAVGTGSLVIGRQVGIETSQDGSVTLNEATLTELLTSNFSALQTFFLGDGSDGGYFGRIQEAADTASGENGVVDVAQDNLEASVATVEESIATAERRLEGIEAAYRRRFSSMETLLAQLNSQSSFLANQLSGAGG